MHLTQVNMYGANLRNANLSSTILMVANLTNADLSQADARHEPRSSNSGVRVFGAGIQRRSARRCDYATLRTLSAVHVDGNNAVEAEPHHERSREMARAHARACAHAR